MRLDSLERNVKEIKRLIGPRTRLMAVVKADAYGHGAVQVAGAAVRAGAFGLAVGLVDEGLELREAGIDAPILVMGDVPGFRFRDLVKGGLTMTIFDRAQIREIEILSYREEKRVPVHLKLDTGMGRLGVRSVDEATELARRTLNSGALHLEGAYTHLSSADEPEEDFTRLQLRKFREFLDGFEKMGIRIPLRHAANSAAAIRYPESRFDLVRVGLALYGVYPEETNEADVKLEPALCWKSSISMVKEVEAGSPISYNRTYITPSRRTIATVPVGYADGYPRGLSNRGVVLVKGEMCPVVGRVCMDQLMVDVTGIPDVTRGEEVTLIGRQGNREVRAEEIAGLAGAIPYEILCGISRRVPRIYL